METKVESFVIYDENERVKFIQYRCLGCGNFEEVTAENGDFKLKKFHTLYVKGSKSPMLYNCHGCNNETFINLRREQPLSH